MRWLALVLLVSPLGTALVPGAAAQDGCTACQCGVAYCEGDVEYVPQVTWSLPKAPIAGQAFIVNYTLSWYVNGQGNDSLPLAPRLVLYQPGRPDLGHWRHELPQQPAPANATVTAVWPEPGEAMLRITLDRAWNWRREVPLEVAAPTVEPTPDPAATPDAKDIPWPSFALPLLAGAWLARRR